MGKGEISRYAERVSLSLLSAPKHERGGIEEGCEADAHPLPPFLPRIFFPSRARGWEMTKELRRGTVARRMGAHTFHGCFRDKRYAGRLDTREYELREEQSAFPGSLVLQLHANPFAYVVQTTTMSRALVSPFLPFPPFPTPPFTSVHARLFTNPLRTLAPQFQPPRYISYALSRLNPFDAIFYIFFAIL